MKFLIIIFTACLLFGCQQNQQDSNQAQSIDPYGVVQVKNADPSIPNDQTSQEKAQYLANLASDVPNVNGATALITNRGVLVGIDVDKDLDQSKIGSIKYAVLEALEHDPEGSEAIVVADADLYQRMQDMGTKMQEGHPIEAISEELANITGRWMPEIPVKDEPANPTDENKQIMDKQEEENLDKIQDEQSNHHK
ncbi:YhcN/YlaJ family sporulation lipoprotein [Gracilibacillus alcaliphilus]|uniref:YhcN/YlaJ family sporulation lipoprotein n=1 Tax=Gracilibacillus alcaliphilus TaxID=1401441 RepID=UPI001959237A|nr:YhcN/YlaJ family sporulation lipoprotein [Gracilibacillus alcaliphilus]MBM7678659.1 YhcN/YlaJ family sporulation lipoprotein [Gracilibacillus alcaliphilus]